jgi:hypothetical protein
MGWWCIICHFFALVWTSASILSCDVWNSSLDGSQKQLGLPGEDIRNAKSKMDMFFGAWWSKMASMEVERKLDRDICKQTFSWWSPVPRGNCAHTKEEEMLVSSLLNFIRMMNATAASKTTAANAHNHRRAGEFASGSRNRRKRRSSQTTRLFLTVSLALQIR